MTIEAEILQSRAQQLTRRALLGRAANGLGALALARRWRSPLMGAERGDAAAKGETGDLADHGRRPLPSGNLRPQAETGGDEWAAYARKPDERPADRAIAGAEADLLCPAAPLCLITARTRPRSARCFPQIGSVIDEICLIRSMTTEAINHDPAHMFMNTGSQIAGRPSMGAWVTYGLGSLARRSARLRGSHLAGTGRPEPADLRRGSGAAASCPANIQGVQLRAQGDPVLYLANPPGVSRQRSGDRYRGHQCAQPAVQRRRGRSRGGDPDRAV